MAAALAARNQLATENRQQLDIGHGADGEAYRVAFDDALAA